MEPYNEYTDHESDELALGKQTCRKTKEKVQI